MYNKNMKNKIALGCFLFSSTVYFINEWDNHLKYSLVFVMIFFWTFLGYLFPIYIDETEKHSSDQNSAFIVFYPVSLMIFMISNILILK